MEALNIRKGTGKVTVSASRGVKKKSVSGKITKAAPKRKIIISQEAYDLTMQEIDNLMKRGERNLNASERKRLASLAEAAESFEDQHDPLPLPSSLPDIIRMRLVQLHINQNFAAKLLGVSDAKFSLIMNGKQKPDVQFIKAVHEKLSVDANVILKAI
ncbi:hypothetical protein [Flavihumibacter petaseus]|uniref:Putative DNA-binding protein n=1 Tax=Flavihumibacter petaseus NBRC 106054 TaxID=1220578 RepID=A0A0E9N061_9BACT|nr:hypothetical protein [Flavihumibacter petaseus]GAO43011.1 putative DNA-binding protein [Flavihumibacter petaseus NBRC 106054]